MLQEKELKRRKIDENLLAEIDQLGTLLTNLSRQQETNAAVQQLGKNKVVLSKNTAIESAVVFLTAKEPSDRIQKALQWIGIGKKLDIETVFNGKTKGVLGFENGTRLKLQLYHFDHYPVRQLAEEKKALKIVVYDNAIQSAYKNWPLALEVLGKDAAVLITIDISDYANESSSVGLAIHAGYAKHFVLDKLEGSLETVVVAEDMIKPMLLARASNHLDDLKVLYTLICNDYFFKEAQLKGKTILSEKRQRTSQANSSELSAKEVAALKSKIDTGIKKLVKYVDDKIEDFEKDEPQSKALQEEITNFLGFVETKGGKYISLQISEGAVADKINKCIGLLQHFFDQLIDHINERLLLLEKEVQSYFDDLKLNASVVEIGLVDKSFTKEILQGTHTMPDKTYEKQITSKGIGSLLMELRTPLFMLMPFMMIFALFGALVGGEDVGSVDESLFFYKNRPCIAINGLPESRGNEYRRFINDIEAARDEKNGVFDREISSELLTEPQLAVVTKEVKQSFGDKFKKEETLDFYFDSKKHIIYLFLTENGDREFVIQQLLDPANKLLSVPSSTRRSIGIGGLIRALSGLSEYRYIILVGLASLVLWFIITRKSSMDSELKKSKSREKQKLNNDLKQYIDKSTRLSFQKWRPKCIEELSHRQKGILMQAEITISKNIERRNQAKLREEKIIQKRIASLKTDKNSFMRLKAEHRKVELKLEQLEKKMKRIIET